jgi:YVTN family beta-propeller protein
VNMLGAVAQQSKAYAYVPNTKSGDVWVIDQRTFQVVNKFPVGKEVQHVVPSHDMTALYATDDVGNVIRRIDPITGQPGETIPVADPYNMYFTPDGQGGQLAAVGGAGERLEQRGRAEDRGEHEVRLGVLGEGPPQPSDGPARQPPVKS